MLKKKKIFRHRRRLIPVVAVFGAILCCFFSASLLNPVKAEENTSWQNSWAYTKDGSDIVISSYSGSEKNYKVPAKAVIDGKEYTTRLKAGNEAESEYSGLQTGAIENISFESGVKLPEKCDSLFFMDMPLKNADVSNLDFSGVKYGNRMFSFCTSLEKVDFGKNTLSSIPAEQMAYIFSGDKALKTVNAPEVDIFVNPVNLNGGDYHWSLKNEGCYNYVNAEDLEYNIKKTNVLYNLFNGMSHEIARQFIFHDDTAWQDEWAAKGTDKAYADIPFLDKDKSILLMSNNLQDYKGEKTEYEVPAEFTYLGHKYDTSLSEKCNTGSIKSLSLGSKSQKFKTPIKSYQFSGCSRLEKIDLSNTELSEWKTLDNVFSKCTSLKEINFPKREEAKSVPAVRYSHTSNIDDTGKATDTYGKNISTNDVVTIPGASKLHVKLYYSTESVSYDWACVWAGSHFDYTASGNYSSSKLGTISGEIGDGGATSMSDADVIEGDIDGDSVTFGFRSDGSGDYYGYYAVVTGYDENGKQIQEKQGHNITKFGSMFSDCSSLENVDLSFFEGLTAEDLGYVFFGCSSLKEVTLPFSEYKNCSFSNTFRGCKSLEKISFSNAAAGKSTFRNAEGMFVNCRSLSTIDFSPFSVGDGLSASTESMFYGCENLESVKFSDSFVKSDCGLSNSSTMFFNCRKLKNIDLSCIKGKIKGSASSMFFNCTGAENIDMSNADTSELKDYSYMFNNCQSLKTLNISNFDTSAATNMHAMFNIDKNLQSLDISGFNTENVTDFTAMFYGCSSLANLEMKSDIIGKNAKTVNSMFAGCSALKSLDLHDSRPSSVTDFAYFLKGCSSLESVDLSNFSGIIFLDFEKDRKKEEFLCFLRAVFYL